MHLSIAVTILHNYCQWTSVSTFSSTDVSRNNSIVQCGPFNLKHWTIFIILPAFHPSINFTGLFLVHTRSFVFLYDNLVAITKLTSSSKHLVCTQGFITSPKSLVTFCISFKAKRSYSKILFFISLNIEANVHYKKVLLRAYLYSPGWLAFLYQILKFDSGRVANTSHWFNGCFITTSPLLRLQRVIALAHPYYLFLIFWDFSLLHFVATSPFFIFRYCFTYISCRYVMIYISSLCVHNVHKPLKTEELWSYVK